MQRYTVIIITTDAQHVSGDYILITKLMH